MIRHGLKAAILSLCVLAFSAGCSTALDRARTAIATVATLERTAGEMVSEINKDTEESIAAELDRTGLVSKAKADRDAWREKRKQVHQALLVCHAAVVAGSVSTELAASGKSMDLTTVAVNAIKALKALEDALKAFGISLPGGGI